jgi:hypothetical protein
VQLSASLPSAAWSARTELYWERVPAALAAPALWRAGVREPELLARWVIGGAVVEHPEEVRRLGVTAALERTLAVGSVGLSAQVESLAGVLLEQPAIRARAVPVPAAAAPLVVRSGEGTAATVVARFGWRWSALSGEGSWRVHGLIEGTEAMERAHRALPRHRLLQHVRWRPRADLDLLASAEIASATRWEGYETDASTEGRLAGRAALQLAILKRVWDDRMEAGVTILDVTDRSVPLHPLGAAPGLTLIVSGTVRLGSR